VGGVTAIRLLLDGLGGSLCDELRHSIKQFAQVDEVPAVSQLQTTA
jgi:hypothetical protein